MAYSRGWKMSASFLTQLHRPLTECSPAFRSIALHCAKKRCRSATEIAQHICLPKHENAPARPLAQRERVAPP